jgi:hypothetical protein
MLLIVTLVSAQAQQSPPPRDAASPGTGTAAISGRITEKDTGRPIHRALVTLSPAGQPQWLEAIADLEGRYEFTGLAPGEYSLWAGPGEFKDTHLRQGFGQSDPMDRAAGPPRPAIKLEAGEARAGVDFALTRSLAIEGRVIDELGEPMADVGIVLKRPNGAFYAGQGVASDDRGEYRVFGLPPGRYRVCASAEGRFFPSSTQGSRLVDTCYPATDVEANAADVVLTTSDATGIDIRMQRGGTYSVSGSVVDATGSPASGAWIGVHALDNRSVSGSTKSSDGRFVVPGLTPGRYIVRASIGGPAYPDDPRPPAREREVGFTTVEVSGDMAGVVVTMSKGERVSGRVVFDGEPVPTPSRLRMFVTMRTLERKLYVFDARPPLAAVDDNLHFELAAVYRFPQLVGIYGLPERWVLKSIQYAGRDITDMPIEFATGSVPGRLEIHLTNRVAAPSVRVVDDRDVPLTSYYVVVLPADPARWKGATFGVSGWPSSDGTLSLGSRLPGDYLVAALTADDHSVLMQEPERLESLAAIANRVSLAEGDRRTLELRISKLPARR